MKLIGNFKHRNANISRKTQNNIKNQDGINNSPKLLSFSPKRAKKYDKNGQFRTRILVKSPAPYTDYILLILYCIPKVVFKCELF